MIFQYRVHHSKWYLNRFEDLLFQHYMIHLLSEMMFELFSKYVRPTFLL